MIVTVMSAERRNNMFAKLIALLTGRKYYYHCSLTYLHANRRVPLFHFTSLVYFDRKGAILHQRDVKRICWLNGPAHKHAEAKAVLCNGILTLDRISYLGWSKK